MGLMNKPTSAAGRDDDDDDGAAAPTTSPPPPAAAVADNSADEVSENGGRRTPAASSPPPPVAAAAASPPTPPKKGQPSARKAAPEGRRGQGQQRHDDADGDDGGGFELRIKCPSCRGCCDCLPGSVEEACGDAPRIDAGPLMAMLVLCFLGAFFVGIALMINSWLTIVADDSAVGFSMFRLEERLPTPTGRIKLNVGTSRYCVNGNCFVKDDADYESESTCDRGASSVRLMYEFAFVFAGLAYMLLIAAAIGLGLDLCRIAAWRHRLRHPHPDQQQQQQDSDAGDAEEDATEMPRSSRMPIGALCVAVVLSFIALLMCLGQHGLHLHCGLTTCERFLKTRSEYPTPLPDFDCSFGWSNVFLLVGVIFAAVAFLLRLFFTCCSGYMRRRDLERRVEAYEARHRAALAGEIYEEDGHNNNRALTTMAPAAAVSDIPADVALYEALQKREVELDEREARMLLVSNWAVEASALDFKVKQVQRGLKGFLRHSFWMEVIVMPQSEWLLAEMDERRHIEDKEYISLVARIVEPWRDGVEALGRPELGRAATEAAAWRHAGDEDATRRRLAEIRSVVGPGGYDDDDDDDDDRSDEHSSPAMSRYRRRSSNKLRRSRSRSAELVEVSSDSGDGEDSSVVAAAHPRTHARRHELRRALLNDSAYSRAADDGPMSPRGSQLGGSAGSSPNRSQRRPGDGRHPHFNEDDDQPADAAAGAQPRRFFGPRRRSQLDPQGRVQRAVEALEGPVVPPTTNAAGLNQSTLTSANGSAMFDDAPAAAARDFERAAYGGPPAADAGAGPRGQGGGGGGGDGLRPYVFADDPALQSRARRRMEVNAFLEQQKARRDHSAAEASRHRDEEGDGDYSPFHDRHTPAALTPVPAPSSSAPAPAAPGRYTSPRHGGGDDGGAHSSAFPRAGPDASMRYWGAAEVSRRMALLQTLSGGRGRDGAHDDGQDSMMQEL